MSGRTFAIGDIHGCDTALRVMLEQIAAQPEDTVILLGDVVDRGPGTRQVLEQLIELATRCRLIFIRGNHEEMMLSGIAGGNLRKMWLYYGGQQVLFSYGGSEAGIPVEHIEFLESSIDYWMTDTELFIHANLDPRAPLDRQDGEWLRWAHLTGLERPHESGRRIICGHTSMKSGRPLVIPGWVCLDTFAHGSGFLSCLDVEQNLVYQTRQTGEFRGCFPLSDFAG